MCFVDKLRQELKKIINMSKYVKLLKYETIEYMELIRHRLLLERL